MTVLYFCDAHISHRGINKTDHPEPPCTSLVLSGVVVQLYRLRATEPLPYLHGDVGDGGGGQVEVLLHQDVELGGQVSARPHAVHLTGE